MYLYLSEVHVMKNLCLFGQTIVYILHYLHHILTVYTNGILHIQYHICAQTHSYIHVHKHTRLTGIIKNEYRKEYLRIVER